MMPQAITLQPATFSQERPLITIEFAPNIHPSETEYTYEHPQFVFGDRVTITDHFPELEFTVCALELVESVTPSGRLLNQPRWKYKVTNGEVSFWKDGTALIRYTDELYPNTCSTCYYFDKFNEASNRGWCARFDYQARTYHIKTNDCILNGADEPLEAFSTEVVELDRYSYPMMETAPTGYFLPNFTTSPGEPF